MVSLHVLMLFGVGSFILVHRIRFKSTKLANLPWSKRITRRPGRMARHVKWYFNVSRWKPGEDEWLRLTSSIADEEVARINQFVYKEDSKTSLIGQALIRRFLTHATNVPSNEIPLTRTKHGRPEVCKEYLDTVGARWPKLLDFNVSHSGDYCVLAGLWSQEDHAKVSVGVDVTKIVKKNSKQELDRFLDLMSRREFLSSEWDTVVQAQTDRQKCINFTRLWCLKESFIKSIGLGLSFKLNRIAFEPEQSTKYNLTMDMLKHRIKADTRVYLDGRLATDWIFHETALDDEHMVAIGYNVDSTRHQNNCDQYRPDEGNFVELSIESLLGTLVPMSRARKENWDRFYNKCTKDRL